MATAAATNPKAQGMLRAEGPGREGDGSSRVRRKQRQNSLHAARRSRLTATSRRARDTAYARVPPARPRPCPAGSDTGRRIPPPPLPLAEAAASSVAMRTAYVTRPRRR